MQPTLRPNIVCTPAPVATRGPWCHEHPCRFQMPLPRTKIPFSIRGRRQQTPLLLPSPPKRCRGGYCLPPAAQHTNNPVDPGAVFHTGHSRSPTANTSCPISRRPAPSCSTAAAAPLPPSPLVVPLPLWWRQQQLLNAQLTPHTDRPSRWCMPPCANQANQGTHRYSSLLSRLAARCGCCRPRTVQAAPLKSFHAPRKKQKTTGARLCTKHL